MSHVVAALEAAASGRPSRSSNCELGVVESIGGCVRTELTHMLNKSVFVKRNMVRPDVFDLCVASVTPPSSNVLFTGKTNLINIFHDDDNEFKLWP